MCGHSKRRIGKCCPTTVSAWWKSSGSTVVQDFGHVAQGDRISCAVTVLADGWEKIKRYWDAREKVDVTDEAGNVWHNMRVTVKAYAYVPHFSKAYKITLEFWRV